MYTHDVRTAVPVIGLRPAETDVHDVGSHPGSVRTWRAPDPDGPNPLVTYWKVMGRIRSEHASADRFRERAPDSASFAESVVAAAERQLERRAATPVELLIEDLFHLLAVHAAVEQLALGVDELRRRSPSSPTVARSGADAFRS